MHMMRKIGKEFRPFFGEATIDVCDFLKDYKRQIPWGLLFERMIKYSNINHSCPYKVSKLLKNVFQ